MPADLKRGANRYHVLQVFALNSLTYEDEHADMNVLNCFRLSGNVRKSQFSCLD